MSQGGFSMQSDVTGQSRAQEPRRYDQSRPPHLPMSLPNSTTFAPRQDEIFGLFTSVYSSVARSLVLATTSRNLATPSHIRWQ